MPLIRQVTEVTNILNEFNVPSEDMATIAKEVQERGDSEGLLGIPIKKFLLAMELAQEQS